MDYHVLLELAIIVITAKVFGLIARKLRAPMVVGQIIAGLVLGPSILNLVSITSGDFLSQMAEIGVIMLMFSAGLQTDIRELLKTGPVALAIACAGVFIPLACGTLLYMAFYGMGEVGSTEFFKAVFTGVIMTATSVSITVETLKEMGKIKSKVGTTILSAAIIDDVIGIMVLTFVIGFQDPATKPLSVVINSFLFFAFAFVVGFACYFVFKKIDQKYPHTRRIPIMGLALCFLMAYLAEEWFGVADITGAYVAGIILCSIQDSDYIAEKMDINSYMLFGPLFFASIGLKTSIEGLDVSLLLFSAAFVVVAMASKVIGCGITSKMLRFSWKDSLKIGLGMMTRGEVALIVAQKGLSVGLLNSVYFTAVILLIICSSVLTPIFLKLVYRGETEEAVEVPLTH